MSPRLKIMLEKETTVYLPYSSHQSFSREPNVQLLFSLQPSEFAIMIDRHIETR